PPALARENGRGVAPQTVLRLQSRPLHRGKFAERRPHAVPPRLVHFQRDEVRLGKVAIVRRLLLTPLDPRDSLGIVPAGGRLGKVAEPLAVALILLELAL